ncbi:hypothetical protein Turpa_3576 [Turneriella parva DSM 21527]|uniref:HNH endonuclease n=2 Tax=Turneriella TaxID=338321 RepID=I4BAA3_TURPD|nr:hypothetical protein Turpa_3576 [Turneriella parva DSM 21527]
MFHFTMESKPTYKFTAKDFYSLLERQNYRCALSGRELTPENTDAEHILPLDSGGSHTPQNIYLIVRDAARLKRHLTEAQVIDLCFDILKTRGPAFGITVTKVS